MLRFTLFIFLFLIGQATFGQFGNDFTLQKTVLSTVFVDNGTSSLSTSDALQMGNYLYVSYKNTSSTSPRGAINIYDVTDPANPQLVKEVTYTDRYFSKMLLENNTLFVIGRGLTIFDVSQVTNPVHIAYHTQTTGTKVLNIFSNEIDKSGSYIFMSTIDDVMVVEMTSLTSAPVFKSQRTLFSSAGYVGSIIPNSSSVVSFDQLADAYYSTFNNGILGGDGSVSLTGLSKDVTYVPSLGIAFIEIEDLSGNAGLLALNVSARSVSGPLVFPTTFIPSEGKIAYSNGVVFLLKVGGFITVNVSNPAAMSVIKTYAQTSSSGAFRYFESSGILVVGEGKKFNIYKSGSVVPSPAPTITGFSPISGAIGTIVTISGTNFSTVSANNTVKFNNVNAIVTNSTATSITTSVPTGATTGPISVTVAGQTATSSTNFTVASSSALSITALNPTSGSIGTPVTITGTNFSTTAANNIVKFSGVTATITGTPTATSINTTVPAGATTGSVTVTVGSETATSASTFTVTTPIISSFSPSKGAIGTTVTITGNNFSTTASNNIVKFNGTVATITGTPTTTSIVTKVPIGAMSGPITVTIGNQTATSSASFQVCPAIAVSISSTNKSSFSFSATGGQAPYTYSLDGINFLSASSYNLGTGTYTVTAKDANGCTGISDFMINGIVDCSVTQSSGGQGTTYTTHILGSGSGVVRVTYEMFNIPDQMEIFYDNALVATTNSLVSGSNTLSFNYSYDPAKPNFCIIKMTAPNSGTEWEYAAYCPEIPTPKVTSFSPNYGNVGAIVTINGYNFTAGTTVKFGTVTAAPVINTSGTSITVNVPASSVTAPISITNSLGTFYTPSNFTVSPYCLSAATSGLGSRIEKVIFSSINNPSPASACESYTDYTSMVGFVSAGQTHDLKITLGTCDGNYNKAVSVFVDWNGDLDFADAGETVATSTSSNTSTREETFLVIVPASLTGSGARMRIVLSETGTPSSIAACGTYTYGETEDYTLSFINTGASSKSVGPASLTEFETAVNFPSAFRTFAVSGVNLSTLPFTVTAPPQFQVSAQGATGYAQSIVLTPTSGVVNARVYVRYNPTAAGPHTGSISITNALFAIPSTVAVFGKSTVAVPKLLTYALFDDFISPGVGLASALKKFRIQGSYLTGNVTVNAPTNFEISLTTSSFTSSLTLTHVAGEIPDQLINVRYNPPANGPHTGNIVLTSTGLTNQNIPLTGNIGPSIANFSPTSGTIGTSVTITGANFSATASDNVVKFNGITTQITNSSVTSITATVPFGATTGPLSVKVGSATVESSSNFIVLSSLPTITSLSPASAVAGTTVTITGTNFSTTASNNSVKFNGTPAVVTQSTPTTLTTTVPAGATTGQVSITVGVDTHTSSSIFTVISATAPTITSFSPTSGSIGTEVTFVGTNFNTTSFFNVVQFGGITAAIKNVSPTSITVVVPSGATTGFVTITVISETVTSGSVFNVVSANAPTISSFAPASGTVGTPVTITGTKFSPTAANNIVKFNGTAAVVTQSTASTIITSVPSGAITGSVSVTVAGETFVSSGSFTVLAQPVPTISDFTPSSGPVGTIVTLTGTNFSAVLASNSVSFNNTPAIVSSGNSTSLTVAVPIGATTGKIAVSVGGATAVTEDEFSVLTCAKPPTPVITSTNLNTESPTLTSSAVTGNQWFLNDEAVPGANGFTFNAELPGVYSVQVSVAGGCVSDFSNNFILVITGDKSQAKILHLTFYPNPVEDKITIETTAKGNKLIRLIGSDGRLLNQLQFDGSSIVVDMIDQAKGMYYFTIISEKGTITGKFLKK